MLLPSVKTRFELNGCVVFNCSYAFACARRIVRQLTPARMKASTKRSSRRSRKLSAGLLWIGRSSPCQTASE